MATVHTDTTFHPRGRVAPLHAHEIAAPEARIDGAPYAIPRLPGPARLIVLAPGTSVSAETRCRFHAQVPRVGVLGPTSRAATWWVRGAPPIEVEVDASAWARLTTVRANTLTDRIVPAASLNIAEPADLADTRACARFARALVSNAGRSGRDEPYDAVLRAFAAMTQRLDVADVATAASELGINAHLLRRLTLRHFGFAPKLLLVRARFLAAFAAFRASDMRFSSVLDFGYFDSSHFLRDANRFLGTTPRRYLERFAALSGGAWRDGLAA